MADHPETGCDQCSHSPVVVEPKLKSLCSLLRCVSMVEGVSQSGVKGLVCSEQRRSRNFYVE